MSSDLTTPETARFSVRMVPASGKNLTEKTEGGAEDRG
jgi:hypothetical protein